MPRDSVGMSAPPQQPLFAASVETDGVGDERPHIAARPGDRTKSGADQRRTDEIDLVAGDEAERAEGDAQGFQDRAFKEAAALNLHEQLGQRE